MEFPPGYRFMPTDEELIVDYLQQKIDDQPIPYGEINVVDVYQYDPQTLADDHPSRLGQKEWYFFTPRDRKYQNGSRPNRSAGDGYWKASGADKPIRLDGTNQIIGYKRVLVYYQGNHKDSTKTDWIMYEYTLAAPEPHPPRRKRFPNANNMRLDDWVICRIHIHKRVTKANKAELNDNNNNNNNNNALIVQNENVAIEEPSHDRKDDFAIQDLSHNHALQPQQWDQEQQQYAFQLPATCENDDYAIEDLSHQYALQPQQWDQKQEQHAFQPAVRNDDSAIQDLSHHALQPLQWDQHQEYAFQPVAQNDDFAIQNLSHHALQPQQWNQHQEYAMQPVAQNDDFAIQDVSQQWDQREYLPADLQQAVSAIDAEEQEYIRGLLQTFGY